MIVHNETRISAEIVEICRRLNSKGMLASADGNVSYKISNERILITPSGVNKAFMNPSEMAVVTVDNRIVSGNPSGERLMHLEVYRRAPQARCVVHAHPPNAIAWSVAQPELDELPAEVLSELILAAGRIPIVPYARPGSQAMGDVLAAHLPECRLLILARHGALSWGEDLAEAYNGMERLEHAAHVLRIGVALGGLTALPTEELKALRAMRVQLGSRTL